MKKKTRPVVVIDNSFWIALTEALGATPDILPEDLVSKARRLNEIRKEYAKEIMELEAKLLKKCPGLDQ